MSLLIMALLALGPSLVWLYWLWRREYKREPLRLVLLLFFGGGLMAVIGTMIAVTLYEPLVPTEEASPIINMLLTAALPEEFFKMLPVLLFAWRSRHWDEPFDGIVYAGATALGFNLIETALYMLDQESFGGSLHQGIVRGTVGGHMVYGIIMGFFLSRARFSQGAVRRRHLALALGVPMLLHTAWNAALTYGGDIVAGDPLAGTLAWMMSTALWVTAFELIRRNREASPWNPAAWTVPMAATACWNCRGAYPDQAMFCHTCGAQVQAATPARTVPEGSQP